MNENIDDIMLNGRNQNLKDAKKNNNIRTMFPGTVISNDDPFDGGRLLVRVPYYDRGLADNDEKMRAFPLTSKIGDNILPKVGEAVWVFIPDITKPYSLRGWLGPINSQYQNLLNDSFDTAVTLTNEPLLAPLEAISTVPSAENLYPVKKEDKEHLTTIGRENTDILHRKNKLTVRAGRHKTNKPLESNKKNPVYTQYRLFEDDETSAITHVSDYHLFMSHKGSNLANKEITDEDIKNIIEKGFSFVKGEAMVELLKLLIQYVVVEHTHKQNNIGSNTEVETAKKLMNFDFSKLLSEFHKIN